MKLTHRQIEVFRAVMRAGHVTRAAEWLHSSQPTLSRELARLEQLLGYALFERVRGRLQPTARALALLQEVEASFVGLERIAATALALRADDRGQLQLAALPALTQALLPEALGRLAADWPQAALVLTPLESPALEHALAEQRMDLGLLERHEAPAGCVLHTVLVADEVAVLPAGHALAARPRLEAGDFAGQRFVSLAAEDPYRAQIDAWFDAAGVVRRMAAETPSAASVCALVRAGLGVAVLNPLTALAWADAGVVLRPLACSIPFHLAVAWPELRGVHPLRARVLAALAQAAQGQVQRLQALGVAARLQALPSAPGQGVRAPKTEARGP